MPNNHSPIRWAAIALAALALSGCGGGGDNLVTPPGPHDPEPLNSNPPFNRLSQADQFAQVEFFENDEEYGGDFPFRGEMIPRNSLDMINAAWLYARGRVNSATPQQSAFRTTDLGPGIRNHQLNYGRGTGAGVTIGIIDSGLDHNLADFQGRLHRDSQLAYPASNPGGGNVLQLNADDSQLPQSQIIDRYPQIVPPPPPNPDPDEPQPTPNCDRCATSQPRTYFRYHADAPPGLAGTYWELPDAPFLYMDRDFDPDDPTALYIERGDLNHGTFVASIAAGGKDGDLVHGVAYEANIHFLALKLGTSDGSYNPFSATDQGEGDRRLQPTVDYINRLNETSDVINYSFGFAGGIQAGYARNNRYHPGYSEAELRRYFPATIAARAQADVNPADRTIHVFAAGNAGLHENAVSTSPEIFPGMVARIRELQDYNNLIVVSVNARDFEITDEDGNVVRTYKKDELSLFSSRCGIAQRWCLAAPGGETIGNFPVIYDDNGQLRIARPGSGTSFAAPHVTGAIAALISYFNGQLGNDEIVQRILQTANKEGIYSNRDIYGQGLLDLRAASEPYGGLRVPTGTGLAGVAEALTATQLHSSAAFGDAWQVALAEHQVSAFDDLDAPFAVSLSDLTERPKTNGDPRDWLDLGRAEPAYRQDAYGQWWAFADRPGHFLARPGGQGFFFGYGVAGDFAFGADRPQAASAPYLDLQNTFSAGFGQSGGFQLAAFHGVHESTERPAYGLTFGWQLSPELRMSTGFLHEEQGMLGSAGNGALATGHAGTWFAGADWQRALGPWQGNVAAWWGLSDPQNTADGLMDYAGPLLTSQIRFSLSREHVFRSQDRFSLVLEQPLRVERGSATLHYPTGRTRYGELLTDELTASLSPSGREWRLHASYRHPIPGGMLELGAGAVRSAGHVRHADPTPFAALNISWDF